METSAAALMDTLSSALGSVTLDEYRLAELSNRSGVNPRNIRAYRERGLLDPPVRKGRSAIYDDRHLAQLKMINELLRRGFTSAHIAEFFSGMRQGQDLADVLGLEQAVFGSPRPTVAPPARLDPDGDDANRLVANGLAEDVDGEVLVNPLLAEIVGRDDDPPDYVRVTLRVSDEVTDTLDGVADVVVRALEDSIIARFGPDYVPRPEDVGELRQILADYRALGYRVVTDRLDAAMRRHLVNAVARQAADTVPGGRWVPADS